MCGRFALIDTVEKIKKQFSVENDFELKPHFNIAPGFSVACVVEMESTHRQCLAYRWGLIPSWAKDRKNSGHLINARCETVLQKPAFRNAIKSRRCIMVMSGFFEWHQDTVGKQPYYIHKANNEMLAVAAFWELWQGEGEEKPIYSCCLVTSEANPFMMPIHKRMPVCLNKEQQAIWLDNSQFIPERLQELMRPYREDDLISYPVTPLVNHARFDNPLAIRPA